MSPMKRKSSQTNVLDHQEKQSHQAGDGLGQAIPVRPALLSSSNSYPVDAAYSSPSGSKTSVYSSGPSSSSPFKITVRNTNAFKKSNDMASNLNFTSARGHGRRTNDFKTTSCSKPFVLSAANRNTDLRALSSSCSYEDMGDSFASSIPLPTLTNSSVSGAVAPSHLTQSNGNSSQWYKNASQYQHDASASMVTKPMMPSCQSVSFPQYKSSNVQQTNSEGMAFDTVSSSESTTFQYAYEYDHSKKNKYQRALDVSSGLGSLANYQPSSSAPKVSSLQHPKGVTTDMATLQNDSLSENCKSDSLLSLNLSFKSQENSEDDHTFSEINNTLMSQSGQPMVSLERYLGRSKTFDDNLHRGNGSESVGSRNSESSSKGHSSFFDVNPAHCENWNFCNIDGDSSEPKVSTASQGSLATAKSPNFKNAPHFDRHNSSNKFETFEGPCSSSLKRLSEPFSNINGALMLTPKSTKFEYPMAEEGNSFVDIPSPVPVSPAEIPLPLSFPAPVSNEPNKLTSTPKKSVSGKSSARSVKSSSLSKSALEYRKQWSKWSSSSVAIHDKNEGETLQRHLSKASQQPEGNMELNKPKKPQMSVSLSAMPDTNRCNETTNGSFKKNPPLKNASATASMSLSSQQRFRLGSTAAAIMNFKLSASCSQESTSTTNMSDIPSSSTHSDHKSGSFNWHRTSSAAEETSSCYSEKSTSTVVVNPRTAYFASEWKELAQSKFSTGFIDTHCHLDFLFKKIHYKGTLDQFKLKMEQDDKEELKFPVSYEGCVAVFCQPESFNKVWWYSALLAEKGVWGAFGCHPHFSNRFDEHQLRLLKQALAHPKVVALGEIGLDYSHKNNHSPSVQQAVFCQQLLLAEELKLPLVIHCRDAHDDCLQILKKHVSASTRIHHHCFADSWREAEEWLEAFPKCFLGLTNLVTQRNANARMVCEAVRQAPLHRLLLETDSPYFVPDCVRGAGGYTSHPGHALLVAAEVARIKGLTLDEVLVAVRSNTRDMYGI